MSLAKFESEVKIVPQNQNILFSRFNDLNSLSAIKDRMNDPEVQQKLSEQVPLISWPTYKSMLRD